MGTERMGCDAVYAWPSADVRIEGYERSADLLYKNDIESAQNPDELRRELMTKIHDTYTTPYHLGGIQATDDIIDPRQTRPILINTLNRLSKKLESTKPWRKHSLIPL